MAEALGDYSQMYSSSPSGFDRPLHEKMAYTGRSWLGQLLGFGGETAYQDWLMNEQSANNAYARDMYKLSVENAFNASEAQRARDFQKLMADTSYQRTVRDMRLAGINPAMAYSQGPSVSGSTASASSGSSGGSVASSGTGDYSGKNAFSGIAQIVSGLISRSATITAAGIQSLSKSKASKGGKK